ncbi:MAG: V-type ATPase subunit [Gammaproteobacteria bacterium]|nr:V-type ATPase subunit [Gammaproteobacteria bacterium]
MRSAYILKNSQYAYMQTMVSIFAGELIKPEKIQVIARESLENILQLSVFKSLANDYQQPIEYNHQHLPAGVIENSLKKILFSEAIKIIRSLQPIDRNFLNYWMCRFELQNIKSIIRGKYLCYENDQIRASLIPLEHFTYLSIDKILHQEDINEILKYLEDTPYALISRYALQHFEQKNDVFSIEASISHQFYEGLNRRRYQFDRNNQNAIHQLLGLIIDQINLITLIRYRLYYGFSAAQTYFHLFSGGLHLYQQYLQKLSEIESFNQVVDYLPEPYQSLLAQAQSIQEIEIILDQNLIEQAYALIKKTRFSVAQAFTYLILREKQLSQLHGIIKGKILGLNQDAIDMALGNQLTIASLMGKQTGER